ncbi:MAG: S1 RNA-binding domain-containing protein [Anaerolineae bacterium]|nr:S1 RNA-binding domain-containing protein [Anaerolineae bacterium]
MEEADASNAGIPMFSNGNGTDERPEDSLFFNMEMGQSCQQDWDLAIATHDKDAVVDLVVSGCNRGGLLVTWNTLRGFVPASQLNDFPVDIDEQQRHEMLAKRVGEHFKLRIIELDAPKNRLILSERAALVQPGQRNQVLETLKAGTIHEAVVTNLCDFGAFADLGGIEGLIHISELSWGRVAHPRDVLSSGQQVKVYIMHVDSQSERIALSLKRLQPDPWQSVERRYEVGQTIEALITNVVDFGAFACIEDGLEGLIHISELAEGQFLHPRNVVKEGQRVKVNVLNIDGRARRLGLSLRQHHFNDDAST